ncbi:hypothetical protein PAV_11c01310 [Paenibacillus alvei DSM 29]|nr:hypothetical protein PAV_11c01310 [Paenibacillus alvei DSM 29]
MGRGYTRTTMAGTTGSEAEAGFLPARCRPQRRKEHMDVISEFMGPSRTVAESATGAYPDASFLLIN